MTIHRLLNIALIIAAIAAWMSLAGKFDRELMEGDLRHMHDAQVQKRRDIGVLGEQAVEQELGVVEPGSPVTYEGDLGIVG